VKVFSKFKLFPLRIEYGPAVTGILNSVNFSPTYTGVVLKVYKKACVFERGPTLSQ
jgi:hypothetical protein